VPAPADPADPVDDPVLARRAAIARLVSVGQRVGYALFGLAMVLFFVGLVAGYTQVLTNVIVGCLLAGSLILAPAIVFGYAVKAAERDEQGLGTGH
jgi:hypothetical protein